MTSKSNEPFTPSAAVLAAVELDRKQQAILRERVAKMSLEDRLQFLTIKVQDTRSGTPHPGENLQRTFYIDPQTGEPVTRVTAATRLVLARARAIREAMDSEMSKEAIAKTCGVTGVAIHNALRRGDEIAAALAAAGIELDD